MHPVEPRSFGTLLSDSFSVLKRNSGLISKTIFIFWILPLIPILLTIVPLIQRWPQGLKLETMDEHMITPELAGLFMVLMLCAVLFCFFAVIGYVVMVSIGIADRQEESLRLREHLSPIIKRNLWWTLIVFICEMIIGEIASMPFKSDDSLGGIAYLVVSMVVSSALAVKLYLVVPSLVLDDQGMLRAVERSWQLTKDHFWQTLGRYFAMTAISAAAVMIPFMFGLVAVAMVVKNSGSNNILEGMQDLGTMMTVFLCFLPSLITMMLVLVIEPLFRSELFYDLQAQNGELGLVEQLS